MIYTYYCCFKSIIDDTMAEQVIATTASEEEAEQIMMSLDWDWGEDDRSDYKYYVRRVDENGEEEVAYVNPWGEDYDDWGYNEDEGFNPYSGYYDFDC